MLMHPTTLEYIKRQIYLGSNHYSNMVVGVNITTSEYLSPTIEEPEWIFPDEPFVKYEQSDRSWCEYFGIGRKGRGLIFGEIMVMDTSQLVTYIIEE